MLDAIASCVSLVLVVSWNIQMISVKGHYLVTRSETSNSETQLNTCSHETSDCLREDGMIRAYEVDY